MANEISNIKIANVDHPIKDAVARAGLAALAGAPFQNNLHVISVDVNGNAQYTSINAAITAAKNAGVMEPFIVIYPGDYNESIVLIDDTIKPTLYGLGGVRIVSSAPYPDGPMFCNFYVRAYNIQFISQGNSYAFHSEMATSDYPSGGVIEFHDCIFIANGANAVGLGLGYTPISFYDCSFYTSAVGSFGIYAHNGATASGRDSSLVVNNCRILSGMRVDDTYDQYGADNRLNLILNNNSMPAQFVFYDSTNYFSYIPDGQRVVLRSECSGNDHSALNYITSTPAKNTINATVPIHTTSAAYIPYDARQYASIDVAYSNPNNVTADIIDGYIKLSGAFTGVTVVTTVLNLMPK